VPCDLHVFDGGRVDIHYVVARASRYGIGESHGPIPFLNAVFKPRQPPRKAAQDTQLVLGQWAEIFANGSVTPLRGFVFSLRPGEVLFTFPDLASCPKGLEAGHDVVVRYASGRGRHTGHARDLARGQRPASHGGFFSDWSGWKGEQRRNYPRVNIRFAARSWPPGRHPRRRRAARVTSGPGSTTWVQAASWWRPRCRSWPAMGWIWSCLSRPRSRQRGHSRQVAGKVLRVEESAERNRAARGPVWSSRSRRMTSAMPGRGWYWPAAQDQIAILWTKNAVSGWAARRLWSWQTWWARVCSPPAVC